MYITLRQFGSEFSSDMLKYGNALRKYTEENAPEDIKKFLVRPRAKSHKIVIEEEKKNSDDKQQPINIKESFKCDLHNSCKNKFSHLLEGFLDEAVTLDTNKKYTKIIEQYRSNFIKIMKDFHEIKNYNKTAKLLRNIRKPLCVKFASFCG